MSAIWNLPFHGHFSVRVQKNAFLTDNANVRKSTSLCWTNTPWPPGVLDFAIFIYENTKRSLKSQMAKLRTAQRLHKEPRSASPRYQKNPAPSGAGSGVLSL